MRNLSQLSHYFNFVLNQQLIQMMWLLFCMPNEKWKTNMFVLNSYILNPWAQN